ncbi:hypothetical protein [Clostridium intestinale]|uniref:hypothetical protein n=1 Tax=Clostridium intestinale TaxID=36845 RepID=UPI002DD61A4C|nr:hypothetical protein [Clostridium intestinale]WRY53161.1 hypothetical protein P8F83_08120 [Clostridium intestinale]
MKGFEKYPSIITDKDFCWYDLKYISDIHYHQDLNEYYEDIFVLDIEFIAITNNQLQYKLNIRFSEVENANFYISNSYVQLISFQILDLKDDGWCSARYWIRDAESENIEFYCNKIEILSFAQNNNKIL